MTTQKQHREIRRHNVNFIKDEDIKVQVIRKQKDIN